MELEEFIFAGELLEAAEHRVLWKISESLDMKASQVRENLKIMCVRVSREYSSVLGVSDRLEENCWPPSSPTGEMRRRRRRRRRRNDNGGGDGGEKRKKE